MYQRFLVKNIFFVYIFLIPLIAQGQTNVKAKFGKGVTFTAPDSSMELNLGVRFQALFVATRLINDNAQIEKEMQIRRMRMKFEGYAFTPKLEYKIELALSNRDNGSVISQGSNAANVVLDAYADYYIRNNLFLRIGQFKLPGNRERVTSSQKLQFVDRSIVNGRYNIDRDQGIMFGHQFSLGSVVVRELGAIALGQGRNMTKVDVSGMSYTGRFEVLPFGEFTNDGDYFGSDLEREDLPKLSLAAGFSYNDDAQREGGEVGSFLDRNSDLTSYFADLMFKYKGASVMSEYFFKKSDDPFVGNSDFFRVGDGFVIQAGYLFKNNYEIAARYAVINPDEDLILGSREVYNETEYTLGVSKYIVGHSLKIQGDVGYTTALNRIIGNQDDAVRLRLQLEIAL